MIEKWCPIVSFSTFSSRWENVRGHSHRQMVVLRMYILTNSFIFVMKWQNQDSTEFKTWHGRRTHELIRMSQDVIRKRCFKGRKGLDWSPLDTTTTKKANLECSIIYKMAVSLYTNTRPLGEKKEWVQVFVFRESQERWVLVLPRKSQKCFKSRRKMSHFWFYVQQWQSTQDLTGDGGDYRELRNDG